jgi:enoyl-CoA hydratase
MELKNLLIETTDGVALLTINSPRTMNALTSAVLGELECALYGLNLDASVKAVVLTGAGEKAFVAGADIKEIPVRPMPLPAAGSG